MIPEDKIKEAAIEYSGGHRHILNGFEGGVNWAQEQLIDFDKAVELLGDLASLQNGAPLPTWEKAWKETMEEIYKFLEKYEVKKGRRYEQ